MSRYVHPNIVIKTLQQIYKTPLYIDAKISIKPNWQSLIEPANATNENQLQKYKFVIFYILII
jgi:hypothetical protein